MSKIDLLVASVISGRTSYERIFDSAVRDAAEKTAKAKKSFIGDRLAEELQKIESNKEETIQSARREVLAAVGSYAEAIRAEELKNVSMGSHDFNGLVEIEKISSLPVSALEFSALCDRWQSGGYWVRKALNDLAAKNGLPYASELLIDEKMEIVDQITRGVADYLERYNGHGQTNMEDDRTAAAFALVSDGTLGRLANKYSAGDALSSLTDERAAIKAYESIKTADGYTAGLKLRNFCNNANENTKNRLLLLLCGDNDIPTGAFSLAGVNVNEWRSDIVERTADYSRQGERLEALKHGSVEDMQAALSDDKHGFLAALIKSESRSCESLHDVAVECGLIEGE